MYVLFLLPALAKEEKERILEFFNVELANPTSILQQEEAKIFFREFNESQLYDFFVRATLLKPMGKYYEVFFQPA